MCDGSNLLDFGGDPGRDPNTGILTEFLPLQDNGNYL